MEVVEGLGAVQNSDGTFNILNKVMYVLINVRIISSLLLPEVSPVPVVPGRLLHLPVDVGDGVQPASQHRAQVSLEREDGGESGQGCEGRLPGGPD